MFEYEKKILLTAKEYHIILAMYNQDNKSIIQRNYYYDTDDFEMDNKGITCRIREKDGKYVATIKSHDLKTPYCSFEKSNAASSAFDTTAFADMNVKFQGYLETYRRVIYSDDDIEIVLDKNTYLGIEDYELEMEYTKDKEEYADFKLRYIAYKLRDIDKSFDVLKFCSNTQNVKTKSARFFEMLKKIKNV